MDTLQGKCSDVYCEWETSFPYGKFLNESCDVMMDRCDDKAQLLIFVHEITKSLRLWRTWVVFAQWKEPFIHLGKCMLDKVAHQQKNNHVVDVTKIINFIRVLNRRQFVVLLKEQETKHGDIGYHICFRLLDKCWHFYYASFLCLLPNSNIYF